jgi:hypothetical protein
MSVEAMTAVFKHSQSTLGSRLVLIALADNAHDDGGSAFPSVETIARKALLSERTVRYCLRNLEAIGEIKRTGVHASGTNIYTITLPGLEGANSSGVQILHRGQSTTEGGANYDTEHVEDCPLTVNEPSVNRHWTKADISEAPKTNGSGSGTKRATAVRSDWTPTEQDIAKIREEGFTEDEIRRETVKMIDHFTANGKPMKDWSATWRNWMRNSRRFAPRTPSLNGAGRKAESLTDDEVLRMPHDSGTRALEIWRRGLR